MPHKSQKFYTQKIHKLMDTLSQIFIKYLTHIILNNIKF